MDEKLTARQKQIVDDMLKSGRIILSKDSEHDYLIAAGFVFTQGLLHEAKATGRTLAGGSDA